MKIVINKTESLLLMKALQLFYHDEENSVMDRKMADALTEKILQAARDDFRKNR